MKPFTFVKAPRSARGFTMVELLISATIMTTLVLLITPLFNVATQGFTSQDAGLNLKSSSQNAINHIGNMLTESKRLFQNTTNDLNYLNRVQMTGVPPVLSGSQLPLIEETGSLSPGTTTFTAGSVGNSLFFASFNGPLDLVVTDSTASTSTIRIDVYHFNYYFLAPDYTKSIAGLAQQDLWEWKSINYADYDEITAVTDATKLTNTVIGIYNSGIQFAWDPSSTTVSSAFYSLNSAGVITQVPSHQLAQSSASKLINLTKVTAGGGYRYGVSPNTVGGVYHAQARSAIRDRGG